MRSLGPIPLSPRAAKWAMNKPRCSFHSHSCPGCDLSNRPIFPVRKLPENPKDLRKQTKRALKSHRAPLQPPLGTPSLTHRSSHLKTMLTEMLCSPTLLLCLTYFCFHWGPGHQKPPNKEQSEVSSSCQPPKFTNNTQYFLKKK